mmetsp:Transcript_32142/g.50172  ORF Transcript_32142/g.50172 Transcript_32142/m.50172 type:complete len:362 (+) Transcript_32142:401-1486(+)
MSESQLQAPARRPCSLFTRLALAVSLVASVSGQSLTGVPYVQGSYAITYKVIEMKGDMRWENACKGPFPYQFTWTFDICHDQNAGEDANLYQAQIAGSDRSTIRSRRILEATPDVQVERCSYRSTSLGPAGEGQNWITLGEPDYPEDPAWQNWKPKDENDVDTEPRTFRDFHLPVSPPYVWGTLCHQYDWQDVAKNEGGWSDFYLNAWRHENETWIFYYDACNCLDPSTNAPPPGLCGFDPDGCNELIEGTRLVRLTNENCLKQKSSLSLADCQVAITGVGGGTVLYPEQSTQTPKLADGRTRFCFMYSKITGRQTRSAEQVARNCAQGSASSSTSTEDEEESTDATASATDAASSVKPEP